MEAAADDTASRTVVSEAGTVQADFATFVRTQTEVLLRIAFLLTGDAASAEDVVQDTLIRLYPRWSRVQNADRPLAYVRRSLVNTYLNSRRPSSAREVVWPDFGDRATPVATVDRIAERDHLWYLMRRLPQRQRAALVLRYFEDLSDRDIARTLGCRVGTVRSLISRGLAALRVTSSGDGRDA